MARGQKCLVSSIVKRLSLFVAVFLLLLPCTVFADSSVLLRIVEEMDSKNLGALKDAKLSAMIKMDEKGNIVVRCLNLLSLPVAQHPFDGYPGMQKLAQRVNLQVNSANKGVIVKLAFAF